MSLNNGIVFMLGRFLPVADWRDGDGPERQDSLLANPSASLAWSRTPRLRKRKPLRRKAEGLPQFQRRWPAGDGDEEATNRLQAGLAHENPGDAADLSIP